MEVKNIIQFSVNGTNFGQWLLSGAGSDLNLKNQAFKELIELIQEKPNIQVIRIINNEIIIICTTIETITALQNIFGDRIIITPDMPLQPL
ncbi:hypothetical protein COL70_09265 [Bacillus pseudomycoides]|uniref:hypothetical protein n=1 Tax=Bacillus pseudomycoides TaxID=64104 RepID=UPI000BF45192|nr:hypothetical protein [Bacillus pseudomycoides]PFZ93246.1 hypothetical protein COL70_09265 [Bacillus pseudomycoides]